MIDLSPIYGQIQSTNHAGKLVSEEVVLLEGLDILNLYTRYAGLAMGPGSAIPKYPPATAREAFDTADYMIKELRERLEAP